MKRKKFPTQGVPCKFDSTQNRDKPRSYSPVLIPFKDKKIEKKVEE